ncbi:MAG: hypothetical protein A07HB70_01067 [uncultured archaeon A07HB70]|nr:MAG: hypothetical protein A07HB70_01067 [uncultured archaeon A07HB70]
MNRRTVLSLVAGVALAGCGGSGSSGSPEPTATGTAIPTAAGPEGLSVAGLKTPDTVPVNTLYGVVTEVENPTETLRRFESGVSVQSGDEWREVDATLSGEVPAGETVRFGARLPGFAFLGTYEVRVDATGETGSVEAVPLDLGFGESFRTPRGLSVRVQGGTFASTYTGGGENTTARTPPADRQWAVITVQVGNPTGEAAGFPPYGAFVAVVGDERYGVAVADADDSVTIPGDRRTVELPYLVPADATSEELSVRWEPTYGERRTGAVWS